MRFEGAVIREQGVTFAVVVVKPSYTASNFEAQKAIEAFQPYFPGLPIVLASVSTNGAFRYRGPDNLARMLSRVHPSQIPWQQYTAS